MQAIESGTCRPHGCGTGEVSGSHAAGRFRGTSEQRADQLVRATVLGDLGQKGAPSGVQGIAAALRKVLSKADVTGTDVPDDVLKKIESSLKKAAQALADRGYDAKTIDATIDKFRSQLADALDSASSGSDSTAPGTTPAPSTQPPAQNDVTSVDQFVAREVRKQKGSIDILTAEGDQVSIRFRTREVVTAGVKQTTAADGSTTTDARVSVISRGRLQVEVNGDLNEGELAAIGELLTKVDEIATRFFAGDVQAAFAAATDLGVDSEQIASYQLDLTYSRKLAAAAWSSAAALPATAPSTQPAVVPATNGPSTSATGIGAATAPTLSSAVPSSGSTATTTPADSPSTTTGPADATAAPSTPPTTPPATAQKTLAGFIGDVLSKLGSVEGAGRVSFSMRFKVNVLVTALETLKPAAPTTPAAEASAAKSTQLLGDSLQKAVA